MSPLLSLFLFRVVGGEFVQGGRRVLIIFRLVWQHSKNCGVRGTTLGDISYLTVQYNQYLGDKADLSWNGFWRGTENNSRAYGCVLYMQVRYKV